MSAALMSFLARLGPYLCCGLLGWALWSQHGTIASQDTEIAGLKEHAATVSKRFGQIHDAQVVADQNTRDLQRGQDQLRGALSQREIEIRSLQHATEELQAWADQPLPDAVIRLRQRPAITGSAAYSEYLSHRQPLQPDGQQPPNVGGPEPAAGTGGK
nr:Rz-like lysis system protein LysB [Bordetella sp. H567]